MKLASIVKRALRTDPAINPLCGNCAFNFNPGMTLFGKLKGLDLKWFSCSEGERKIPVAWSPILFPGRGKNPAVKKSQHKSPLIFFYAAPPFSGLARPM
jgi:hypothetical protein